MYTLENDILAAKVQKEKCYSTYYCVTIAK